VHGIIDSLRQKVAEDQRRIDLLERKTSQTEDTAQKAGAKVDAFELRLSQGDEQRRGLEESVRQTGEKQDMMLRILLEMQANQHGYGTGKP
jgi:hypothetical protein